MKYTVVERQLKEVGKRISRYKDELAIADEQLNHLQDEAADARMRSLVSETAIADQERREVDQQVESMNRHYQYLISEIKNLEERQDQLLEKISKATAGREL
jgi:chromosome segregation ATPase|tara:strand:- start:110 stop:415 length:306 start_codon:yes stop_codon:yes gene_type:complete